MIVAQRHMAENKYIASPGLIYLVSIRKGPIYEKRLKKLDLFGWTLISHRGRRLLFSTYCVSIIMPDLS